jgi:hypothetical protein
VESAGRQLQSCVRRQTPEGCLIRAPRRRREASFWYESKAGMKIAPSTTTVSVAATMSSPVTCGDWLGTLPTIERLNAGGEGHADPG